MSGEWDTYFGEDTVPKEDRHRWAMLAIKRELVYNGIPQGGMTMTNPDFGAGTTKAIKLFQTRNPACGDVDGVVGPKTAHELFKKRIRAAEVMYGVEPQLLCKNQSLESTNDPACLSPDRQDRGLQQINKKYHPDVTDEMAYDPAFAVGYGARYLSDAHAMFKKEFPGASEEFLWDLALASYNVGTGPARTWGKAGRPEKNADGTVSVAWRYVHVVRSRKC